MSSQPSPRPAASARLGAIAWIGSLQFFVAQVVVQSAWRTPFSLTGNYISDLGNTACGPFPPGSSNYVCSPWHAVMNASFILTGVTMLLGAALLRDAVGPSRAWRAGLVLIGSAGLGFVLVGLYPENANFPPHRFGAALHFVLGNLGQIVLGISIFGSRSWRGWTACSIVSGCVGLLATALFVSGRYAGLGIGGMERVAAYPLPLWTIATGVSLMRRHRLTSRARQSGPELP
jgi:hypothetical membrane protein